jgi:DNA-binding NarL/FixJ family response regulator
MAAEDRRRGLARMGRTGRQAGVSFEEASGVLGDKGQSCVSDDRRCLVVDGHPVVRIGVRGLLRGRYDVEEAADWRGALDALTETGAFDVAVIELDSRDRPKGEPGGASMIRALSKAMPGTGIVAHARQAERHAMTEAFEAGASAYVAKSSPPETLESAIEAAAESTRFVDPATNGHGSPLTPRQREVLQLLADGLSTDGTAHRLGLSAETIRTHTKATIRRLDARDRAHAVAIALRSGLID